MKYNVASFASQIYFNYKSFKVHNKVKKQDFIRSEAAVHKFSIETLQNSQEKQARNQKIFQLIGVFLELDTSINILPTTQERKAR